MKNDFLKLTILNIVILTLSSSIFLKQKNAENNTSVLKKMMTLNKTTINNGFS